MASRKKIPTVNPTAAGINAILPIAGSAMSMAGINSDHTDAAIHNAGCKAEQCFLYQAV